MIANDCLNGRSHWKWSILLILALSLLAVVAGGVFAGSAPSPDVQRLAGRWLRPDGGYILQLSGPGPNGQLQAAYFNPKPINVARAEWRQTKVGLGVFVELRDVNYPGSTYTLHYDPVADQLKGIYFQAVMRQQFEVEFVRHQ